MIRHLPDAFAERNANLDPIWTQTVHHDPAALGGKHQAVNSNLPVLLARGLLRQCDDVIGGITQGMQGAAIDRNRGRRIGAASRYAPRALIALAAALTQRSPGSRYPPQASREDVDSR